MFEIAISNYEELLTYYTEEEYMSFYLQVPIRKNLFCSPLRNDKRPTCSFYRDVVTNRLTFKDFGNDFTATFLEVVMERYHVDENTAVKIIKNDFGIESDPELERNILERIFDNDVIQVRDIAKIEISVGKFTDKDLSWWNSFGITESTLKHFHVFRADYVFLNDAVCSRYTDYDISYGYFFGYKDGVELWKIYYPNRKKARFLLNCSLIQGLEQLPKEGNILVVTKSLKDVMVLYELGIPAIAPQAESITLERELMLSLKDRFKYIVFNGDWDPAGKKFMISNRKLHGGICMTFKDKQKFGKDISDFVKMHGISTARLLVNNLIRKCKLY